MNYHFTFLLLCLLIPCVNPDPKDRKLIEKENLERAINATEQITEVFTAIHNLSTQETTEFADVVAVVNNITHLSEQFFLKFIPISPTKELFDYFANKKEQK